MRLLRAADRIAVPWKNGMGETREVALFPENAGWEDFHWRLSIATVSADGPFSVFPGIDRSLAVLDGELRLTIDGVEKPLQKSTSPPTRFRGEAQTFGALTRGPVTDLNLMIRRGTCRGSMKTLDSSPHDGASDLRIIVATACFAIGEVNLVPHDVLMLSPGEPMPTQLIAARGWLIRIIR